MTYCAYCLLDCVRAGNTDKVNGHIDCNRSPHTFLACSYVQVNHQGMELKSSSYMYHKGSQFTPPLNLSIALVVSPIPLEGLLPPPNPIPPLIRRCRSSHSPRAQTLNHPIFHNAGLQSVRGVSLKWQYIGEKYFQSSKYTYIYTSIYASSLPQLIPNLTRAHHCRMR